MLAAATIVLVIATLAAANAPPDSTNPQTQFNPHPAVKPHHVVPKKTFSVKFKVLSSRSTMLYWRGDTPVEQGRIDADGDRVISTYDTHQFFLVYEFEQPTRENEIAQFTASPDKSLYVFRDENYPGNPEVENMTLTELAFRESYFERTGMLWGGYYSNTTGPRTSPVLYTRPTDYVGQVHTITSNFGFWKCNFVNGDCAAPPASADDATLTPSNQPPPSTPPSMLEPAEPLEPITLKLTVVNLEPRVIVIDNFLSADECEHIKNLGRPTLKQSTVGNDGDGGGGIKVSDIRTSKTTWLKRAESKILDNLSKRAADVMGIDESIIASSKAAEEMQLVRYELMQKYDEHHDWGIGNYPESRYITFLLYLTDMESPDAGGETAFPKALPVPIKVHPGKGGAVMFYNLLPDGNGDDRSLHAALPVRAGEKWLSNYWVWDPHRHFDKPQSPAELKEQQRDEL